MAKIRLTHPTSTPGANLYGSLRPHRAFVSLAITLENGADHFMEDSDDDTGFKGARASHLRRVIHDYDRTRPSYSQRDRVDPETGLYRIGLHTGHHLEPAPELDDVGRKGAVIEVAMSWEQFAEMLVSTGGEVDCTLERLWGGIGLEGQVYTEEVDPPPPIADRARRRMEKAQAEALAEIDKGLAALDEMKATKKVKDQVRETLRMTRQSLLDNAPFVMTQAAEELSRIGEATACLIGEKIGEYEKAGRLPPGSTSLFRSGGGQALLLPPSEPMAEEIPEDTPDDLNARLLKTYDVLPKRAQGVLHEIGAACREMTVVQSGRIVWDWDEAQPVDDEDRQALWDLDALALVNVPGRQEGNQAVRLTGLGAALFKAWVQRAQDRIAEEAEAEDREATARRLETSFDEGLAARSKGC